MTEIQDEIELTSERRTELWNSLSHGYDPSVAAELKRLSDRLEGLLELIDLTRNGFPVTVAKASNGLDRQRTDEVVRRRQHGLGPWRVGIENERDESLWA